MKRGEYPAPDLRLRDNVFIEVTMHKILPLLVGTALLAGCASSPSYVGGRLVGGQSTTQDVEAQMGQPSE